MGGGRALLPDLAGGSAPLTKKPRAGSHHTKTAAHAAHGDVAAAEREKGRFDGAASRVPPTRTLFNNVWLDIFPIASEVLDGEVAYHKGRHDTAFDHLRQAIRLEDSLPYDEPWGWMQPVRHALGALLLEQGRVAEAEAVYREDLGFDERIIRARRHPDNVWSLHGFHECLRRQGKHAEADLIETLLARALARSDVPIRSCCFCRLTHGA